jgi:hypothetical protein
MVTAEFAVALPALVVTVMAAVSAVVGVTDQMRCADAAAVAVRLAARGEPPSVVRAAALQTAPRGAQLTVTTTATTVSAVVAARLAPPGLPGQLPAIVTRGRATAARETALAVP